MISIVLVAAVAENGVIGHGNAMPWRLKTDLRRFRSLTTGKPVIMGRKTFESIGAPLKGRTNIVVTREARYAAPGVLVASDFARAVEAATGDARRRGVNEIIIGGGSEIYAAFLPQAHRMEITRVAASPDGDTRFPQFDAAQWDIAERATVPASAEDVFATTWLTYTRRLVDSSQATG